MGPWWRTMRDYSKAGPQKKKKKKLPLLLLWHLLGHMCVWWRARSTVHRDARADDSQPMWFVVVYQRCLSPVGGAPGGCDAGLAWRRHDWGQEGEVEGGWHCWPLRSPLLSG